MKQFTRQHCIRDQRPTMAKSLLFLSNISLLELSVKLKINIEKNRVKALLNTVIIYNLISLSWHICVFLLHLLAIVAKNT